MLVSCGVSKVCLVPCWSDLDTSTAVETENMHEAVAKMKLYRAVHGPIALHGTHRHTQRRRGSGAGRGRSGREEERSRGDGVRGREEGEKAYDRRGHIQLEKSI